MASIRLEESWKKVLAPEFEKDYFKELSEFVRQEYQSRSVFPPAPAIFRALDLCPFENVKVVILGQDPYHGPGQANGLAFSVNPGILLPPSLQNIYKEIEADLGLEMSKNGDLENWARQGVLLLNATLTVTAHEAGSHQKKGWESFTDTVISAISSERAHVVFLLWGKYAQDKASLIDAKKHLILEAPHPSPLSAHRGFFGSKHFSQANAYLEWNDLEPIDWTA